MDHALGATGENRLDELEQLKLGLQDLGDRHELIPWAKAITALNLIFLQVADANDDIVVGATEGHLLCLVILDVQDLAGDV